MKIKKWTVYGLLGLISIGTGIFLLIVLLDALSSYGLLGYLALGIFLVSLISYIIHEKSVKADYKIIDRVVKETVEEYKDQLDPVTLGHAEEELRERLIKKVHNENFTLFNLNDRR